MKTCERCGQETTPGRDICKKCMSLERWLQMENEEMEKIFPPKVVKNIKTYWTGTDFIESDVNIYSEIGNYCYGRNGNGKTVYLACVLMELKKKAQLDQYAPAIEGCFICLSNLIGEIKDTFTNKEISTLSIIKKYSEIDVLIIDEMGFNIPTDWNLITLYSIINNRYNHLKRTFFTSNIDLKELEDVLQDSKIPSRIKEMCCITHFKGSDYRFK